MDIEIKIDENYKDIKVIILAQMINNEVNRIISKLNSDSINFLAGFKDDNVVILDEEIIVNIYANSGKVFAVTDNGEYILKFKLYELESKLDDKKFVRISNSEIINLKKVKSFDLSFIGTICVSLMNGKNSYVSRRYIPKIRQKLGL